MTEPSEILSRFVLEVEGFRGARPLPVHEELLDEGRLPDPEAGLWLDYHMPGMNGLELVAQLRGRDILIPAILITPAPSENLRDRAAAAGIPIVEKPLLGSRLLDSIRIAFDGHTKTRPEPLFVRQEANSLPLEGPEHRYALPS